jgi:peptide/nickel transport system substrate-binding protein
MKPAPLLLLVVLLAAAVLLGLRVMLATPALPVAPPPAAAGAAAAQGVPQGHVYTGVVEEPEDVNPFTTHGQAARRYVLAFTHEALLDVDPRTGELRPALASAFAPSADGSGCTFTLREGVEFADGSPLTMADVVFGWELAQAGHLPLGFVQDAFARVAGVDVLDDRRLHVRYRGVHYAATRAVGEAWLCVQRRYFVDRVAAAAARQGVPVPAVGEPMFATLLDQIDRECGPGTGPYLLRGEADADPTWRRRQDLLLVRNERCWRRTANPGTWNLAGVRLLFRDPAAAHTALLRGELDWHGGAVDDLLQRPEVAAGYRKVVYDYPTLGVLRVIWNCRRAAMRDPRLRRALAHLCDQDAVLSVFGPSGRRASALAKPESPEYPRVEPIAFAPDAARRTLRELGFDPPERPLRLVLLAPLGTEALRRTGELLVSACKQAGVDLVLRAREWPQYLAEKQQGDWDGLLMLHSFRAWGDPYDFLHSGGADNEGAWQHPDADRLAAAARGELDVGRRTALLRELHELVFREQPCAFLLHPLAAILLNANIQAAEPGVLGLWPERFWVPPAHQRR